MSSLVVMGLLVSALAGAATAAPPTPTSAPPPAGEPRERVVRQSRPQLGTVVEIMASVAVDDDARAAAPLSAAFDEIKRVESLVDEDDPRTPVWRINQQAGGGPVVVDPELFFILSELHRLAKLTQGAFDLTAGVYAAAWHFESVAAPSGDPTGEVAGGNDAVASRPPIPQKAEINRIKTFVGFDALVLDPATRTVQLKAKGARIAVRSVARGYALERAASILEERGLHHFVIAAGGDLVVRGQKGARPWMVGVQDPRAAGHFAALAARAGAVMTTGDYEEFFFDGGVRYHNVLDPRTGQPATKCRSVTVLAKDALSAEALSRAIFVLGARDGVKLIERLKGVDAIVVTHDNKVVMSKGLKAQVQVRPPTDGP